MALSRTTKRSIDLSVSGAAALCVLAYFIYRRNDKNLGFLIFVLIMTFGFSYLITTRITKAIWDATIKKDIGTPVDSVKVVKNSDGTTQTVSAVSSVDISALTRRVRNDLYDTPLGGHSNDVWWQMVNLSDTDLSNVYNQWNKDYFDEYSESLVMAINAEVFDSFGFYDNRASTYSQTVISRLERMGAR